MYVDFNGKRVDLGWNRKVVAALVTAVIVGGGVLLWQMWPRERVVYVNQPAQPRYGAPTVQAPRETQDSCLRRDGYYWDLAEQSCERKGVNPQDALDRNNNCPADAHYDRPMGRCVSEVEEERMLRDISRRMLQK